VAKSLEGTAALVTAGGTGLGLGIAKRLAQDGCRVTVCARRVAVGRLGTPGEIAAAVRFRNPLNQLRLCIGSVARVIRGCHDLRLLHKLA
jgi:NAD(P)-dependent dehydrogenase (short-subunit alcohol dehydrogenase family)